MPSEDTLPEEVIPEDLEESLTGQKLFLRRYRWSWYDCKLIKASWKMPWLVALLE